MDQLRQRGTIGGTYGLLAMPQDPNKMEMEHTQRMLIVPQRGAYRIERQRDGEDDRRTAFPHISDGTTTWMEHVSGGVLARPARGPVPYASALLDPSWLTGYDWDTPVADVHNERGILVVHARLRGNPNAPRMWLGPTPAEAEVLVDSQYGFLHRVKALVNGQPFQVEEFLDLILDPPIDESAFRIDESKFRIIDEAEQESWNRRPLFPLRVWWAVTRPSRRVERVLMGPFRQHRHRPR